MDSCRGGRVIVRQPSGRSRRDRLENINRSAIPCSMVRFRRGNGLFPGKRSRGASHSRGAISLFPSYYVFVFLVFALLLLRRRLRHAEALARDLLENRIPRGSHHRARIADDGCSPAVSAAWNLRRVCWADDDHLPTRPLPT